MNQLKNKLTRVQEDYTGRFYEFRYSSVKNKCSFVHFQLRNLVWATSKNEVYYTYKHGVYRWCPLSKQCSYALDLRLNNLQHVKITSMVAKDNHLLVGGFGGEFVYKNLEQSTVHSSIISPDTNGITNHLDMVKTLNGYQGHVSNNDCRVRMLNMNRLQVEKTVQFDWPVNCTCTHPNTKLMCVVGDHTKSMIVSTDNGQVLTRLKGHKDYSFACSWSPCGRFIATGNQDTTCRLYDVRNMSQSFMVLGAKMGAVRSLRFSPDGRYLAMAEPADYVHIFDVREWNPQVVPTVDEESEEEEQILFDASDSSDVMPEYGGKWVAIGVPFQICQDPQVTSQIIDFFGEISGISFTPDGESLFVGNVDASIGCIIEFEKKNSIYKRQYDLYL